MSKINFFAFLFLALFFLMTCSPPKQEQEQISLELSIEDSVVDFPNFWHGTGFNPAKDMLEDDMKLAMSLYGHINNEGMVYIRPHYMLDLIECDTFSCIEKNECDYSKLDEVLDLMVDNNLKPTFELMGNPSGLFTDYGDTFQLRVYKQLIYNVAMRYLDRYGEEEVLSWYFETVNEPNWHGWWDHGFVQFLYYYDACSEALRNAHPEIVFGGPGTWQRVPPIFQFLMDHCHNGINFFTGERGTRLDFISFHVKDISYDMIEGEWTHIKHVQERYPDFKDKPFLNTEADPTVGWGRDLWWRPSAWYAAFVVQSVDLHSRILIDSLGVNYRMLFNDHGFLGGWYHRTMLARLYNADSTAHCLVKKPVMVVKSLMSLLGEEKFLLPDEHQKKHHGLIATRRENGDIALLSYNKPAFDFTRHKEFWRDKNKELLNEIDSLREVFPNQDVGMRISLQDIYADEAAVVHYRIDEQSANAYTAWKEMGSPQIPSTEEYRTLLEKQEPLLSFTEQSIDGTFSTELDMQAPSVSLVVIADKKNSSAPKKLTGLRTQKFAGIHNEPLVLLTWDDANTKNIKSYEIFVADTPDKEFAKVNRVHIIDPAFIHLPDPTSTTQYYKVRTVDYWDRKSDFSTIVNVEF